ncbi:MAG: glyoxalase [Candidatus Marisimplicoccus sp.]|nr:MAG: glyoxalase [Flavobacteriales bacterium]
MNDRPNDLIKIRPVLNLKKSSQITDEESFQNDTLRPIIKLQSPVLIETYRNYIIKHKNVFYELSNEKKLDYIENSINKNQKFRNLLKGMIIGLFTIEEYHIYKKNSSSLNKRMMNIILKRLQDNLQIF